jgi:hypothetical protein
MLGDRHPFALCDWLARMTPICGLDSALDFTSERSGYGLAFLLPSEPGTDSATEGTCDDSTNGTDDGND